MSADRRSASRGALINSNCFAGFRHLMRVFNVCIINRPVIVYSDGSSINARKKSARDLIFETHERKHKPVTDLILSPPPPSPSFPTLVFDRKAESRAGRDRDCTFIIPFNDLSFQPERGREFPKVHERFAIFKLSSLGDEFYMADISCNAVYRKHRNIVLPASNDRNDDSRRLRVRIYSALINLVFNFSLIVLFSAIHIIPRGNIRW